MNVDINSSGPTSLKDFQAFLGDLLEQKGEKSTGSVRPITEGLGLESPQRASGPVEKPTASVAAPARAPEKKVVPAPKRVSSPPPMPRAELADVISQPEAPVFRPTPPPLPSVSFLKRAASLFLDQVFVQTLWVIALVITSNIFSGFETGLSAGVFKGFSEPLFFRFAVLEFATIWLAYLAISLGIFNMTFGMWVWGIRISYGNEKDENYGMRKLMRILWSFLFYGPVFPTALLAFRKNDRNLLDAFSGSNLYLVQ